MAFCKYLVKGCIPFLLKLLITLRGAAHYVKMRDAPILLQWVGMR